MLALIFNDVMMAFSWGQQQLLSVTLLTAVIATLCFLGSKISIKAMTEMFFPEPLEKVSGLRRPRWELFRALNWIMAVTFTFSLYFSCTSGGKTRSPLESMYEVQQSRLPKAPLVVCFLSLVYLLGFFGVSLSFQVVEDEVEVESIMNPSSPTQKQAAKRQPKTVEYETEEETAPQPKPQPNNDEGSAAEVTLDSGSEGPRGVCEEKSPTNQVTINKVLAQPFANPSRKKNVDVKENYNFLFNLGVFSPILILMAQVLVLERARHLLNYFPVLLSLSVADVQNSVASVFSGGVTSSLALVVFGAIMYKLIWVDPRWRQAENHGVMSPMIGSPMWDSGPSSRMPYSGEAHIQLVGEKEDLHRGLTYPPPFPNGWYKLADSSEILRGDMRYIKALGLDLVVFRADTDEGAVGVLNAYCPHLGANLAFGGSVKGSCIECPFHKWQLGTDGEVKHIPYTDKIPKNAKTTSYHSIEFHGMIAMWYHAEKEEPFYYPPRFQEIDDGEWTYRGAWNSRNVRMHLQEFAENSVDFQHFQPLHGQMNIPWTDIPIPGIQIHHKASWESCNEDGKKHIAYFRNTAMLRILGTDYPRTKADAETTYVGPGGICFFKITIPDLGTVVIAQTHLPLKPMLQQTQFRYFASKNIPRILVSYIVGNWISQWKNDIMVWENKVFLKKPLLVSGDGPISRLRRWYKQFYTEGSKEVMKKLVCQSHELDW